MDMVHCPYCLTHAGSAGVLPAHGLAPVHAETSSAAPVKHYIGPLPSSPWASASPRAPPLPA